jgi:hypothetical protein
MNPKIFQIIFKPKPDVNPKSVLNPNIRIKSTDLKSEIRIKSRKKMNGNLNGF